MIRRNLESWIVSLETRGKREDEFLLIWSGSDRDVQSAIEKARHLFSPGQRVALAVWYGDGAPPAPKWLHGLRPDLSEEEELSIDRLFEEQILRLKKKTRRVQLETAARPRHRDLDKWSDAKLLYEILKLENWQVDGPFRSYQFRLISLSSLGQTEEP